VQKYSRSITDQPDEEDIAQIKSILGAHNQSHVPEWKQESLAIFERDEDGRIVAGISGWTLWNWLHISYFAVDKDLRGKRVGEALLKEMEAEAIRRGCQFAFLDTFSFQARPFYEKMGYKLYGQLDEFPPGHQRYFMWKALT
jgi:GNAT superfamily N-acetyltransferase